MSKLVSGNAQQKRLDSQEEKMLFQELEMASGNPAAIERVLSKIDAAYEGFVFDLVCKVFKKFNEDAMQEGKLALIQAAYKFDADYGTRFTTFAYPYVHGAIVNQLRFESNDYNNPLSLNKKCGDDEDSEIGDFIADESPNVREKMIQERTLEDYYEFARTSLNYEERKSFEYMAQKEGHNCSLDKLGKLLGVSKSTAKRIYDSAKAKVKDHFNN